MSLNPAPSKLDQTQILQRVFNGSDDRLRTDATATISGITEVSINQADDSIKIGDGTNLITSTNVSGKQGLDVNVISSTGTSTVTGTVSANLNGLAAFVTTQYTVGTSAVQLTPSPLANRSSMIIKVSTTTADPVYIGSTSGVTTSTGFPLFNGDAIQMDLKNTQDVYAIATAAGQSVYVLEIGG